MTFALFLLYVVLLYLHPAQIVPALAPYHVTYWIGMVGLAAAIVSLLGRRDGPVGNLQLWGLIGLTTVMGVSLMMAERWLGAPVMTLQRFGPSLTVFVLAMCSVTSMARLRMAAGCVMALTTALVLQGAAAYHFDYNSRLFLLDRATSGEDPAATGAEETEEDDALDEVPESVAAEDESFGVRRIRALGFMNDPNDLALAMIVALGLIAGAWKPRLHVSDVLLAAAAATLVYGIYLTRSRGGALALVVVLWRFAASRSGLVPSFALFVALSAGAMTLDFGGRSLSGEFDESVSERLLAWTEGLEMLKTQPLLGVGYGQFMDHHTLTAHNSLVLSFAETGLIGCFFWVGLLAVTLLELHRLKTLPGDHPVDAAVRPWAHGLQLSLIGFLTAAFFLSRTFVPTLYLVLGLAAALAAIARAAKRPLPLPPLPELGLLVFACELAAIGVVYALVKLHVA